MIIQNVGCAQFVKNMKDWDYDKKKRKNIEVIVAEDAKATLDAVQDINVINDQRKLRC